MPKEKKSKMKPMPYITERAPYSEDAMEEPKMKRKKCQDCMSPTNK